MSYVNNQISMETAQKLIDALQQAQFSMYAISTALNKLADDITKAVQNAGINVVKVE